MSTTTTDTIIIGAGSAGLYAAFALGLQGLQVHVVDALPHIGGQCVQLYADKPIYDIPAIPSCTGQELANHLYRQVQPFNPVLHLQKRVTGFSADPRATHPSFNVTLDDGCTITARSIVMASGTGAFLPKKINLEGSIALENQQLFYRPLASVLEAGSFSGKHIVISGDLEATLVTANQLAMVNQHHPASVTLLHRRDKFRAQDNTQAVTKHLRSKGKLNFIAGQLTQLHLDEKQQLTHLSIKLSDNQETIQRPADILFILHGLAAQGIDFATWGLHTQGKQLLVDTATFQTNIQGIFAIGDAITYPGKRQLIVSAFHEATLASYGIASYLRGGKPVPQLYTTSSSKLQELLGKKHS